MSAQDLYEWIKESLIHFGLRFAEMDKVHVSIRGDRIYLAYGDQEISRRIGE